MNEYERLALEHWTKWLPSRLAMIAPTDRETYFAQLGEQVQTRIVEVEEDLEAQQTSELQALTYLEKLGRLNAIRAQAREMVLSEMVLLEPEATPERSAGPEDLDRLEDPLAEWMDSQGMPRDRSHPLWQMQEDETVSTEEFAAAARKWEESLWQQVRAVK